MEGRRGDEGMFRKHEPPFHQMHYAIHTGLTSWIMNLQEEKPLR
jgi:hypothetical protein